MRLRRGECSLILYTLSAKSMQRRSQCHCQSHLANQRAPNGMLLALSRRRGSCVRVCVRVCVFVCVCLSVCAPGGMALALSRDAPKPFLSRISHIHTGLCGLVCMRACARVCVCVCVPARSVKRLGLGRDRERLCHDVANRRRTVTTVTVEPLRSVGE